MVVSLVRRRASRTKDFSIHYAKQQQRKGQFMKMTSCETVPPSVKVYLFDADNKGSLCPLISL